MRAVRSKLASAGRERRLVSSAGVLCVLLVTFAAAAQAEGPVNAVEVTPHATASNKLRHSIADILNYELNRLPTECRQLKMIVQEDPNQAPNAKAGFKEAVTALTGNIPDDASSAGELHSWAVSLAKRVSDEPDETTMKEIREASADLSSGFGKEQDVVNSAEQIAGQLEALNCDADAKVPAALRANYLADNELQEGFTQLYLGVR